ncbi:MAG: sulfurtransferase [Euryarchaeota archaeon]|nr:sulfurtransferase [Euryarchaeota archaeon]
MENFLVDIPWVLQHRGDPGLRLVDLRRPADYLGGHIPGAVNIPIGEVLHITGQVAHVPPAERFAATLGARGISNDTHVVAYDDRYGTYACRFLYTLDLYGHTRMSMLGVNFDRYQGEGHPLETGTPAVPRSTYTPRTQADRLATKADVLDRLKDPGTRLVDTRSPQEFMMGHIPGAASLPWMSLIAPDRLYRSPEELRALLREKGVTPDREVICYCNMGMTSSHTYWALRQAGYPRVRMYPESYTEWGMDPTTPKE